MQEELYTLAESVGAALRQQGVRLAAAESCTGGWIAKLVTDVPGSSEWFEAGFVTYSNRAKQRLLGVDAGLLAEHGAVSRETVEAMARGALTRCDAHVAVAVSGIAGPDGGSADKPVGTVWVAWASVVPERISSVMKTFTGDREAIRRAAVIEALDGVIPALER